MKRIRAALGTAEFGTSISRDDSWALLDTYASRGGRIIDTANNYACWQPNGKGGDSEWVIGRWLEKQERTDFTVITKIGSMPYASAEGACKVEGLSASAVHNAVEQSLHRLGTDCLDILLAHHDDLSTPLRETWEAFTELKKAGKIAKIGVSNYQPKRMVELAQTIDEYNLAPVEVVELKYSVISPLTSACSGGIVLLDNEMKATLKTFLPHATVFGFAVLLGGLFEKHVDEKWPAEYDTPQNRRQVAEIQLKAQELGVSPSAYVLKLVSAEGIFPIIATRHTDRLISNMKLLAPDQG